MNRVLFLLMISWFALESPSFAQLGGPETPDSLSVQGLLTDAVGDPVADGMYDLVFTLYKNSSNVWQETHANVPVSGGVFNVLLGSSTSLADIPFDEPMELGVKVETDAEMSPRIPLTPAAYALGLRGLYVVEATDGTNTAPNLVGGASNNYVAAGVVGATIGGGGGKTTLQARPDSVLGDWGTVAGGTFNTAAGLASSVGGGLENRARGSYATVAGGNENTATGPGGTVGGGLSNIASGDNAFVGGGVGNEASNDEAIVGGGFGNGASGHSSFVGGGAGNAAIGQASTVVGGFDNSGAGYASTIGGGYLNATDNDTATVAGGTHNVAMAKGGAIGGGSRNHVDFFSTVSGGSNNAVNATYAVIAGGQNNTVLGTRAALVGGNNNTASGTRSFVGGGQSNDAGGTLATVGGGNDNNATGEYATVPGGDRNDAIGYASFAAGTRSYAVHSGSFLWQDSTGYGDDLSSTADNQWLVRASGGVTFLTAAAPDLSTGSHLAAGSGSWADLSSKASKTGFEKVDALNYLERAASLDIMEWSYKTEQGVTHVGPMAEDFYAAFGHGPSERSITTVDASGVALAAIQGLYELIKEQQAEIERLRAIVEDD